MYDVPIDQRPKHSYIPFCIYRFRTLIRPYYRGAAGMVLAYDVTDEKTFSNIEEWMNCIAENTQECQIIQKVILANKTDLDSNLHRVPSEEGQKLADKHGVDFYEVSAKEGQGINEAFVQLTKLVLKAQTQQQQNRKKSSDEDEDLVVLQNIPVVPKKERKCCFK